MNAVLRFFRLAKLFFAFLFLVLIVLGSSETARASHLVCGTTYYYRARSTDASNNTTTSSEKSFTTSACPAGESGGGSSGSGGTTGGGGTSGTTTGTTTTTTTTTGTKSGTSTATGSTTTGTVQTTTKKTTTTATAAKTTATPKPGEPTPSPGPAETPTQVEAVPAATVTQAIAIPQSIGEFRTFYSAVAQLDFCSGGQKYRCIDRGVLPPLSPPPPPPPPCQDGAFDFQAEHLRGPKFLAGLIERVVPEIPCDGPAEEQADQPVDSDAQYCAGYQESSLITKFLVANPCVELDQIGEDRLDCYADLALGTPCILGEGADSTPSPDGTGEEIIGDQDTGELICPPPSNDVGDACVAQDSDVPIEEAGDDEIGPDDVCLPSRTSILTKIRFLDVETCSFFEDGDGDGGCPAGFGYEGVSERCIKSDGDGDILCDDGSRVTAEGSCPLPLPLCPDGTRLPARARYPQDCPPPPDCGIPTDFRQPSRASHPLTIIDPVHRHVGDPEVHIKAGESVTIGAELTQQEAQALGTYASAYGVYAGYLRNVDKHPEATLIVPAGGGYSAGHASLAQDDLSDFLSIISITEPTRVTYTGVQPSTGGFCLTRGSTLESISIIVDPNPDLFSSLVAAPSDVAAGGVSSLQWFVNDGRLIVREVQLDNGTGFKPVKSFGRELVQPQQTTTYTLRIITDPGSRVIDRQATVTVRTDQTLCGDGTTWVASGTFPAGCPAGPPGCASLTSSLIAPRHAHPSDPTVRVTAGEPIIIGNHYSGQENTSALFEGYVRYAPAQPNLYKVIPYRSAPDNDDHRFTVTDDGADFLAPGAKITEPTLVQYSGIGSNSCSSATWLNTITVLVAPAAQGEPAASLTATPDVIIEGGRSALEWASTNANSVTLNGKQVQASGAQIVSPAKTTDYTLVATGPGGEVTRTVTVTVTESVGACIIRNPSFGLGQIRATPPERGPHPSPLTVALSAGSTVEDPGRLVWWFTTDGTDPARRAQERRGNPDARGNEITLTLLAPGARVRAHLFATDPCNLELTSSFDQDYFLPPTPPPPPDPAKPTVILEANGVRDGLLVGVGDSAELTWISTNATTCEAKDSWSGNKPTSGNEQTDRHFFGTKTYTIRCEGQGGSVEDFVSITVRVVPPSPPTVTLSATPTEVPGGGSFTLTWSSSSTSGHPTTVTVLNVVEGPKPDCSGQGTIVQPASGGSITLPFPTSDVERCGYTATASGPGGSATSQVVLITKLAGTPPPPPAQPPLVVTISHNGGSELTDPVSVTLQAQVPPENRNQLVILYTTDPAVTNIDLEQGKKADRYNKPITISKTAELRAIAFLSDQKSAIARALFSFKSEECKPALLCGLRGNFKLKITPDPQGKEFEGPTEFEISPIPPDHKVSSLHLEPSNRIPNQNSAKIGSKITLSERGTYAFKAFGSESDPLTVFVDIKPPPPDGSAPTVSVSPAPGTSDKPIVVGLGASGGSAPLTISYTTNGADPRTGGTTYQGPLTLTQSTFLNYVAKDSAGKTSAVGQAFYEIVLPSTGGGAGTSGPGSTLLTWPPVFTQISATSSEPLKYEVSCNGQNVGTVDEPIVNAPAPKEPCSYTVAAKSGDQVVESIATVTPVALAAAPAAPAAKAKAPTTPVAKAAAFVEVAVVPAVATTATVATVVAATGAASAPVAAAASGLLYQVLAHGFGVVALLGWRRKGSFTEVLDRTTGLPVGGATVTLIEARSTRATAVATSDSVGRFSMLVDQPGRYLVRVSHPRYATWYSAEVTIGKPQEALELPTITLQTGQVATGLSRPEAYSQLILSGLNAARLPLLIAGTLILLATSVEASGGLRLTPDRSASIALYVALWVSEAWVRTKPRPYGVVVDAATGQPVTRAIVRLLDGATGRLVRTVVTGSQGRFHFLAPKGSGSLVVVHGGYEPYRQDHLMLTGKDSLVNETVRLRPTTEGAQPITPPPFDSAQGKPQPPVRPIVPPQLPRHGPPPPGL